MMYRWLISMMALMLVLGPAAALAQDDESKAEGEETETPEASDAPADAEEAAEGAEAAVEETVEAAAEGAEAAEAVVEEATEAAPEEAVEAATEAVVEAEAAPAEAPAEEAAAEEPEKVKVSLVAEAGVVWLAGNTQSITANGAIAFGLSKGRHAFSLGFGGNYGRSVIKEEIDEDGDGTIDVINEKWATTGTRIFGDLRYDLSLVPDVNSIYVGAGAFHDPFAGYVFRIRADLGYSHTIVNTGVHTLVGEAGFNFTNELYVDDPLVTEDDEVSARSQNFVGARFFAGYKLTPSDAFGFFVDVEALVGGTDNVDARFDGRLAAETGIMANLSKVFSIKLGFAMAYDFVPPDIDGIPGPDVKALDTTTTATLVATLF